MELNKLELNFVEDATSEAKETSSKALVDLQLALVGGGIADTVPF